MEVLECNEVAFICILIVTGDILETAWALAEDSCYEENVLATLFLLVSWK